MKLLPDTNAFIWMATDPQRVPAATRLILIDPANTRYFSTASAWEMAIKAATGKMGFSEPLGELIRRGLADVVATELQISLEHALAVEGLPRHHNDPFDRIIISQTQIEGMTLVTSDHLMAAYGIPILW